MMVFRHQVRNPGVFQTSIRLCHSQVRGHRSRVSVCWSLITAVSEMKTNGSRNASPTLMPTTWVATHSSLTRRGGPDVGVPSVLVLARPGSPTGVTSVDMAQASPSRPELRRMSRTVNTIESANRTSAITHAEPVSKRWKPRL